MASSSSQIQTISLALFFTLFLLLLSPFFSLADTGSSPSPTPQPSVNNTSPPPATPAPSPANYLSPPAPPSSDPDPDSPSPTPGPAPAPAPAPAPGTDKKKSPSPAPLVEGNLSRENQPNADLESNGSSSGGMSGRQKAGIAVGVIAAAFVVGIGGFVYKKRQQNLRRSQYSYAARREFL